MHVKLSQGKRKQKGEYMAERDQRWDIFKGFAVFLVVLGHLTDDNTVLETLIYTVHMPIFLL